MNLTLPADLMARHPEAADHARVVPVLASWWGDVGGDTGARERALLLPPLFFQHFGPTSFLAERPDGALAAFLIGFHSPADPQVAYIHFVGVDPDLRGRGVGAALYQAFFDQARACGRQRVHCVTSPDNTDSQRFHLRMGFSARPGVRRGDSLPVQPDYDGPGHDRVAFTLDLP